MAKKNHRQSVSKNDLIYVNSKVSPAVAKTHSGILAPLFPFKADKIKYTGIFYNQNYLNDCIDRYGGHHLSNDEVKVITNAIGTNWTLGKLKAVLAKNCNVQDPLNWSWPDIIAALLLSGKAKQEDSADTEQNCDYSKPMSKTVMMKALGIDSLTKFNGFAKQHRIKKITRKTWQLRLNDLSSREREKLEKA